MQPKVCIETTIISYLAARPSRDLIVAGHQQITHEWWQAARPHFTTVSSQLVARAKLAPVTPKRRRRVWHFSRD